MLFCPSFTQSERFLHTDHLITRLRRAEPATCCSHDKLHSHVVGNVIVNVFKSDAVIWWAAIFRTPHRCSTKLLHLSKSPGSAMSSMRSHDLREAISDLLTVSMHLQDSLSRFHRPGLHKVIPSCPRGECVDSHLCVSRIPELLNCPCTAQSSQENSCTSCSVGLSSRFLRKLHHPQCHQLGLTRTQANHVLFLGRRVHGIPRVFNRTLDPNCNARVAATIFDVPAPSGSVITTTEPCGVPAIPGTSRLQPMIMLHAGFTNTYLSKRLMLIEWTIDKLRS